MSTHDAIDPDALLTAEDVAKLLGVNVAWVYAQSRRRRIPTVTLGRYRRYRRAAIESWVRAIEADPSSFDRPMGPVRRP